MQNALNIKAGIKLTENNYAKGARRVIVACTPRQHHILRARHLKLFKDAGGFYVRTGKSGIFKRYLCDMAEAIIVDSQCGAVIFCEY